MFRKPKKLAGRSFRKNSKKEQVTCKFITNNNNNSNNNNNDVKDIDNADGAIKRGNFRSRKRNGESDSSDDEEDTRQILEKLREPTKKKTKITSSEIKTTSTQVFQSLDPSQQLTGKDLATRTAEYHPVNAPKNGTAENEENEKYDESTLTDGKNKIYKGKQEKRNKFHAGPLKASSFVRTTCRFDYQPDICKDYKETGFCGFGDTCIYLHDRGDTLSGWQLEEQWEQAKKKERERKEKEMNNFIMDNDTNNKDNDEGEGNNQLVDDSIPFACHICRNYFTNPVVTTCGHYFCEKCIINEIRKGGSALTSNHQTANNPCPICGKDTHGVFNHPTKLIAKKRRLVGSKSSWEEFQDYYKNNRSQ